MIREMYRTGVSISEIARRTGRDRKTIRQAVNAPDLSPPKQPRQVKACKIDPYVPYLEQRMAEGVLNARKHDASPDWEAQARNGNVDTRVLENTTRPIRRETTRANLANEEIRRKGSMPTGLSTYARASSDSLFATSPMAIRNTS